VANIVVMMRTTMPLEGAPLKLTGLTGRRHERTNRKTGHVGKKERKETERNVRKERNEGRPVGSGFGTIFNFFRKERESRCVLSQKINYFLWKE
jgi:hypothetical protein